MARKRRGCTGLGGNLTSALLLPVLEAGARYPVLTVSVVVGTFANPELLLGVKGHSSWIPLGSAGVVLAAVLPSETRSQDVSAPAGTHQRPT